MILAEKFGGLRSIIFRIIPNETFMIEYLKYKLIYNLVQI